MVEIDTPDLCDPNQFRQSLGLRKVKLTDAEVEGEIPGLVRGRLRGKGIQETIKTLLRKGSKGVLLILDEAQTMGAEITPDQTHIFPSVLKAIHNGKLKNPSSFSLPVWGGPRRL